MTLAAATHSAAAAKVTDFPALVRRLDGGKRVPYNTDYWSRVIIYKEKKMEKQIGWRMMLISVLALAVLSACGGSGDGNGDDGDEPAPVESNGDSGAGEEIDVSSLAYPAMADAYDITSAPYFLAYSSNTSYEEMIAFYQDAMVAEGWTSEGSVDDTGEVVYLNFNGEEGEIQILITAFVEGGGTSVMLSHFPE